MIDLGPHALFIVAAYAGVFAVTLGLIAYVVVQSHNTKARLLALEAQGIRRRSSGQSA